MPSSLYCSQWPPPPPPHPAISTVCRMSPYSEIRHPVQGVAHHHPPNSISLVCHLSRTGHLRRRQLSAAVFKCVGGLREGGGTPRRSGAEAMDDGGRLRRSLRRINPFKTNLFRLPATPRLARSRKSKPFPLSFYEFFLDKEGITSRFP